MKRFFLSSMLMAAACMAFAQTARMFTVNLTPDGKANMVAYLPEHPSGRAVIGCPGGGYSHLSLQNEGHDWASFFNRQGIAYFVLTYRMPNGDREIPMSDGRKAIRTVRDSAYVWGINPRDVGMMGFSAGGHLASTMATHNEFYERPSFSILFYPVISMNERETHKGSCVGFLGTEGQKDEALVKAFSNYRAVRRHLTPPAIILLANDDRAVPPVTNGIAYYSSMRRAGNECALHVYPTGGHGFGMNPKFAYHDQMLNDLTQWLQRHKSPRPDAIKVACIGNSITDGHGIEMAPSRAYPAMLQSKLGNTYEVRNFGVSARTLLNKGDHPFMAEMAWRDAKAFAPDVVVIKLGTNDSKPENWCYGAEFENNLIQMIDTLCPMVPVLNKKGRPTRKMMRAASPRIFLCTPIHAAKPSWNINDSVITSSIIPIIKKVAQREKLQIIDLNTQFDATDRKLMQQDGIHPTEQGDARIAEIVFEAIKK
jgi:acetyl esterase/lipase